MDGPPSYPQFYRPLAFDFIRVLELEPGNVSDPIVGRLVPQPIDGAPYEAVSYVWGDTRNRRDITIDGATLSVTANLHGALTAFRHPASSGQPRRLWADAVCINQDDLPERTSQVNLMGRLFAGASRVLAWLGWEEGEEDRRHIQDAIRFIHSFMKDPEAGLQDARILLHHHDAADPAKYLTLLSDHDRRLFEKRARKWKAVKLFFEIDYFHRTWIVQELGLAREAIMYTALRSDGTGEQAENRPLELDSVPWPLVGEFTKFLDYNGASVVTHLGLLAWVAHHILMVWEVDKHGAPECDFLTAMHWIRILGVTDPRDRVYSLLGHPLAVLNGEMVVKPDYTVTRGVIYTKLAANFIQSTKNLYVVSLVDHEEDPSIEARDWDPQDESKMPSWVPDWHTINRTTPMDYPQGAADMNDAQIRIDGPIDGVKGTPLPHLLVRGWVVDEISAVSRRMETTDFPLTNMTQERAKTNPFWLDRVWELIFPAGSSTELDALAVLESLSLALPMGTWEQSQSQSKIGPQQTLEDHEKSFAAYVLEYHELLQSGITESNSSGVDGDVDYSYLPARSLYDSLPGDVQAEIRRRAEGVSGTGFLECMTWPSMCRVVYRTKSGLVGMGSRVTRPGDVVCRVRGSPVMMTLRRIKDYGGGQGSETRIGTGTDTEPISFAFIAPTVVPARMKKGVVDGGEFGERAAHFRIV